MGGSEDFLLGGFCPCLSVPYVRVGDAQRTPLILATPPEGVVEWVGFILSTIFDFPSSSLFSCLVVLVPSSNSFRWLPSPPPAELGGRRKKKKEKEKKKRGTQKEVVGRYLPSSLFALLLLFLLPFSSCSCWPRETKDQRFQRCDSRQNLLKRRPVRAAALFSLSLSLSLTILFALLRSSSSSSFSTLPTPYKNYYTFFFQVLNIVAVPHWDCVGFFIFLIWFQFGDLWDCFPFHEVSTLTSLVVVPHHQDVIQVNCQIATRFRDPAVQLFVFRVDYSSSDSDPASYYFTDVKSNPFCVGKGAESPSVKTCSKTNSRVEKSQKK